MYVYIRNEYVLFISQKFYPDLVTKTTFAIPAIHAYGHDVACQVAIPIF